MSETATGPLVPGTMGERCVTCGAPFAADQRYCVHCGERRGKARFAFADLAVPKAEAPAPMPRAPKQRRTASGPTFIAGIGTLLLAMGVGVLIGHNGNPNSTQRASAPVQVVTVAGSGGAAGATPTSTTGGGSSSTSKSHKNAIKPKKHPTPTKVVQQKAAAAASKVLGGSANLPPPTTKVGSKGSGHGYHNGKFDGGFFGP